MKEPSLRIVHGFCVTSIVFRPLLIRLSRGAADASLFRYPSVGLSLHAIVDCNEASRTFAFILECVATDLLPILRSRSVEN